MEENKRMKKISLFPEYCWNCTINKEAAPKHWGWEPFKKLLDEGLTEEEALDKLGYARFCCRRHYLGFVPQLEEYINMTIEASYHKSEEAE